MCNKNGRVNQLKIGVVLTYLSQGIHIVTGLVYTPVMLRIMGQSEYGLYQMAYAVVSYLSLLNFGFGGAYMRLYSRYQKEGDEDGIARLNGLFMTVFGILSLLCMLIGLIMVFNIDKIYNSGLSLEELQKTKSLMMVLIYCIMISFPANVFDCIITARESFVFQKMLVLIQAIMNPFVTLPLLLLGWGSMALVIGTAFFTTVKLIVSIYYCIKKANAKFSFHNFDFGIFKETFVFTFFIFVNMIVSQINLNVDKILLGRYSGTISVAVYGLAYTLNVMYTELSTAISSVFVPRVNKLVVEGKKREVTMLFTKVGRIQFVVLVLAVLGFAFFGKEFVGFWGGEGYEDTYYIALILMVSTFVPLIQNLGIEVQRAMNMHKVRSLVYLAISIGNLLISIPLTKHWQGIGAAAGTAFAMILGNCIFMNVYYDKALHIDIPYFWKSISSFAPAVIIMAIIGGIMRSCIHYESLITLLLGMVFYAFVYCGVIWIKGLNSEEKGMVCNLLKR